MVYDTFVMAGPTTHLVLREEDVVKLSCEFLHNRDLHISQARINECFFLYHGIANRNICYYLKDKLFSRLYNKYIFGLMENFTLINVNFGIRKCQKVKKKCLRSFINGRDCCAKFATHK